MWEHENGTATWATMKWLSVLTSMYLFLVPGYILIGISVIQGSVLPLGAGVLVIVGIAISTLGAAIRKHLFHGIEKFGII